MSDKCGYKMSEGLCGAPIVADRESYSGFSHEHRTDDFGQKVDWLHWASPVENAGEPELIFKPCAICGKFGPDNEQHVRFDGHRFEAVRP